MSAFRLSRRWRGPRGAPFELSPALGRGRQIPRMRRMMARARFAFFAALALGMIGSACSDDEGGGSAGGALPAEASAPNDSNAPGLDPASLPLGEAQAWLEGDALVSAVGNGAPRGAILAALARAAGFELAIGPEARLEQLLSLRVEHEPLEVALARALAGVSHELFYSTDASGASRLTHVRVGLEAARSQVAASDGGRRRRGHALPRPERTPEQHQERAERARRLRVESLENLASPDEALRADAAKWLDVSKADGFEAAKERLLADESPIVRAAAAEALLDSDVGAVKPLLQALEDPDSRVVLAALEALEFVGDASTVPQIAPLLKHKDVEVRERTVEAIEFLQ